MARVLAALLFALAGSGCDMTVDRDGDDYPVATDCDDDDPDVHPFQAEIADDGIDQDCNGADLVSCFYDGDSDGFGTGATPVGGQDPSGACVLPNLSDVGGDCDDGNPDAFPGGTEVADDGFDQDCSGADTVTCFVDGDGDGYGAPEATELAEGDCLAPDLSASGADCDDDNAGISPGALDVADDGVDQDCSGADTVVCWYDGDDDGYGSPGTDVADPDGECGPFQAANPDDCDDAAPFRNPGMTELCDSYDNDCDGVVDRGPTVLGLGAGATAELGAWDLPGASWTVELAARRDDLSGIGRLLSAVGGKLTLSSEPAWTLALLGAGADGPDASTAWTHLAVVSDGGAVRLLVDGVATPLSGTPSGALTDGTWILGGSAEPFVGVVDELRIWSVARTDEQLAAGQCDTLAGDEPGLRAWWPFEASANEALSGDAAVLDGGAALLP